MKPPVFAYAAPDALEECLELMAEYGDEAKLIAGGQSLMPLLNLRMAAPSVVVDIARIGAFGRIQSENGSVAFGPMVRQRMLERDAEVRRRLPLLAEAAPKIGHVATRSRGTVVGSLCHADPAAELPICATLLEGEFTLASARGTRRLGADQFFVDALVTALEPDEVVTAVRLPAAEPGTGYAFDEVSRRHGDFALVAVAGMVGLAEDGSIASASVAVGGASGRPARFARTGAPAEASFADFAAEVAAGLEPGSDIHASADYRRAAARHLVERVLATAATRAEKEANLQ